MTFHCLDDLIKKVFSNSIRRKRNLVLTPFSSDATFEN
jgi:hypothetical protein